MKPTFATLLFAVVLIFMGCQTKRISEPKGPIKKSVSVDPLMIKAEALAQKFIITDGHVDLPYRLRVQNFKLQREFLDIPVETDKGDFDYVRAKRGGLDAPFMSIYIPASYQETGGAKNLADTLIDMVNGIIERIPDKFGAGGTPAAVKNNKQAGKISLPMGMENGAPIEGKLENVSYFFERGIRYITLTHSRDNHICDSSYDTTSTWKGLSPFGEKVVAEMNRVGMLIDISHVSDNTFYQVMRLTKAPVIASHSSCRKFTPGFERNMDDDMLRALARNGGIIQINFGSTFLEGSIRSHQDSLRNIFVEQLKEQNLSFGDEGVQEMVVAFQKANPVLFADVELVADHIDHVVKIAGIEHVGFGSDFDGVGDTLPTGLKDVAAYPNLIYTLLKRGYSEEEIEKICYKNQFRVWQTALDFVAQN